MRSAIQMSMVRTVVASALLAASTAAPVYASNACLGNAPEGLAIDSSDFLWLANYDINTTAFFAPGPQTLAYGASGTAPIGAAQGLSGPTRIAVSGDSVYVTNSTGNTLTIWNDSTGKWQTVTGVRRPLGIAVDGSGNYFVADNASSDIQAFTSSNASLGVKTADGNGHPFYAPGALAINNGYLYVGTNDGVVHSYNESAFLADYYLSLKGINDPAYIAEVGTFQDSTSGGPTGIAFDRQGNVYVSYYYSSNVVKYSATGQKLMTITAGVSQPEGIAVEASTGVVFVANTGSHDITMYDAAGAYLGVFTASCFN